MLETTIEADPVHTETKALLDSGDQMPYVFFAIVVLVIIAAIASSYMAAQRRKALAEFANTMGWLYSADDPFGIPYIYSFLDCLNKGYDQRAFNVMHGRLGDMDLRAFDYRYTTGSGKNRTVHRLSAVIAEAKYALKPIIIRPEHFGDRLAGMLGFEDIDFEWEEFNRAFYVKAEDKQFAYDVINQKMMEYLMDNRGWTVQIQGTDMIVYNGTVFGPEEFASAANFARVFLALLPDYLQDKLNSQ